MKAIDFHSHVIPAEMLEHIERNPERYQITFEMRDGVRHLVHWPTAFPVESEFHDAAAKVAKMDRLGLDVSVISCAPPMYFYWLPADQGLEAARIVNDGIAAMCARFPDRLHGMVTVPMQDPDAAIAELERAVKTHGFRAIETGTSIEGQLLADPKFRPVLKKMQELKLTLFTHPYRCIASGGIDRYYLNNMIGFPLDTTIMAAHLIFSGALDELPDLDIVLAHGGGYLPYQIGRFAHGHKVRPEAQTHIRQSPMDYRRRFHYDALLHYPQSVRHLIDAMGADRVVIGSDCPYDMADVTPVASLERTPRLTDAERELIRGGNATRLLRLA